MEIKKKQQYNQGIGKYKVLSSTAGVGSLVTTKWGGFIMPQSFSDWQFIKTLKEKLIQIGNAELSLSQLQDLTGVEIIEDTRFIEFLRQKKQLPNLKCFVSIPHTQLDCYNQIDKENHPMFKKMKDSGVTMDDAMFYIPAINFPQWFISSNYDLKHIDEWRAVWQTKNCNDGKLDYFAPPRDPNRKTYRTYNDNYLNDRTIYGLLKPVPMVLICPNGHISDIPWDKYFSAKLDKQKLDQPSGFDLFKYDGNPCPKSPNGEHRLQWITNRNQSESWGILKCVHCESTVSLAGIMNVKPYCRGERPWDNEMRFEKCTTGNFRTVMQMALVTSNSVYYASNLSSLYIPDEYLKDLKGRLTANASKMLKKITEKIYPKYANRTESPSKEDFWEKMFVAGDSLKDAADNDDIELSDNEWESIRLALLEPNSNEDMDVLATYRQVEYEVFATRMCAGGQSDGLLFEDIELPDSLKRFFAKIQKVNTLAITTTQLGFSRVTLPSPSIIDGKVVYPEEQIKSTYACNEEDVYVLPANQLLGEGIFFMFNEEEIDKWIKQHNLEEYYKCDIKKDDMGKFLSDEMSHYGRAKFYLIHTFSHIIMKELEFSCGYPCASLMERIYYSDKMCGVLIYTADGAEGSMGGLVWQGQPRLIESIIKSALSRAQNCSSDPMCWENEDGLNRASCFSCTMISETSCEHRNLGLDRRALVDDDYGYFKVLIDDLN